MIDLSKPIRIVGNYSLAEVRGDVRTDCGIVPLVIVHWLLGDGAGCIRNGDEFWELNGYKTSYRVENIPPEPRKRTMFMSCYESARGFFCNCWFDDAAEAERYGKKYYGETYLGVHAIELDESKLIRRPAQ